MTLQVVWEAQQGAGGAHRAGSIQLSRGIFLILTPIVLQRRASP